MALHQVRYHLSVCLSGEDMPFRLQVVLQFEIVLDDPVVYHHHIAMTIAMRVRILLGGASVGGPASMSDAERSVGRT